MIRATITTPIQLEVSNWFGAFQGSVCGIHFDDSIEKAKLEMRDCGCEITETGKSKIEASCNFSNVAMTIRLNEGKIRSIRLVNMNFIANPVGKLN